MSYHDTTDINLSYVHHAALNRKLRRHQDQLFERYSKLLMLRVDFSYLQDSDSHGQGDIHSTVADITLLIQRSGDINGLVGYAWVLEYTEQHGYHIHAAFYLNGQKHRKIWPTFKTLQTLWSEITREEGCAYRCTPQTYYKVQGERVTSHSDMKGRKGMLYILSYLSKQDQKGEKVVCQLSDIPAPAVGGRRRRCAISE
ncbi:inovirus-type Gp2 protein [Klebsiella quasipneumoniae]|uniref:inovirus-type Gp2 protein n=1 Tax=Klebsiella TaxID=570 RepID=UPI0027D1674E|nr:inovirus-type Gp2 protein [Klebsiella quasipneumoniae]MDQ2351476.1 inovirus-type Gp2 protein [Klebsiella quasipneumoniae]HBW1982410.1 inovirus Gp2 family protein [Klebsiella quasipneumoniae subsp. similipneumoniae]HCM6426494.1 inovirus-type Gp2 protein [Klebsiella quasipneumoniae]